MFNTFFFFLSIFSFIFCAFFLTRPGQSIAPCKLPSRWTFKLLLFDLSSVSAFFFLHFLFHFLLGWCCGPLLGTVGNNIASGQHPVIPHRHHLAMHPCTPTHTSILVHTYKQHRFHFFVLFKGGHGRPHLKWSSYASSVPTSQRLSYKQRCLSESPTQVVFDAAAVVYYLPMAFQPRPVHQL